MSLSTMSSLLLQPFITCMAPRRGKTISKNPPAATADAEKQKLLAEQYEPYLDEKSAAAAVVDEEEVTATGDAKATAAAAAKASAAVNAGTQRFCFDPKTGEGMLVEVEGDGEVPAVAARRAAMQKLGGSGAFPRDGCLYGFGAEVCEVACGCGLVGPCEGGKEVGGAAEEGLLSKGYGYGCGEVSGNGGDKMAPVDADEASVDEYEEGGEEENGLPEFIRAAKREGRDEIFLGWLKHQLSTQEFGEGDLEHLLDDADEWLGYGYPYANNDQHSETTVPSKVQPYSKSGATSKKIDIPAQSCGLCATEYLHDKKGDLLRVVNNLAFGDPIFVVPMDTSIEENAHACIFDIENISSLKSLRDALEYEELIMSEVMTSSSWRESFALAILHPLEQLLRKGCTVGKAMAEAFERATAEAVGFAKDHPVYCTLIALGILVVVAPWVIEALGFAELGPVEGSFAAWWQARYAGYVPYGSWFSYFQRLGMTWRKMV